MTDLGIQLLIPFVVGILSSLAATYMLFYRTRIKYSMKFEKILSLVDDIKEKMKHDGFDYEFIVTLGRNSGVIGSILSGQSNLNSIISVGMKKIRLSNGERTIEFDEFSESIFKKLKGRKVLLLICCNDSGASLRYGFDRILRNSPAILKTFAVYTMPSPIFKPDYHCIVVGVDTKKTMTEILNGLPWTKSRWIHPFGNERI